MATKKPTPAPSRPGAIRFDATLLQPAPPRPNLKPPAWSFLTLPAPASAALHSRGQVCITGTLNAAPFRATLEPDGSGGHWLKVPRALRALAAAAPGDLVALSITPVPAGEEPEPAVPADLRRALAAAAPPARDAWADITPAARRDWIHWITSGKRADTRVKRLSAACDMLAQGKRRPCCFDRSGRFDKSLTCPAALAPTRR